ncbi:hypothetical protein GCM10009819_04330 [Agromyces tropicus]|uniref:AbiEi antitoxin C-terminal domain-containing protein n=1 Tax=Agromyces tropicus TaxID=555371 RepID=A0ABN2TYQ3_9MICO
MTRLPAVLGDGDLPLAELCAARIDGELMRIGDGWCPVDEPDLPALRAAAAAAAIPSGLILERRTAAWVHGALPSPPPVVECCVSHSDRVSMRGLSPALQLREVAIEAHEVAVIGGIRCTTPERTIHDLVRDPTAAPGVEELVRGLLAIDADAGDRARRRIERAHRMPHKALALARLDAAVRAVLDQPSLTR